MKTPVSLLIIILPLLYVPVVAQKIDADILYSNTAEGNNNISYVPGNKLTIEDFKGRPAENSAAVAITSSGFSFKAGFKNSGSAATLIITVSCNFDKNNSWMKEHGKNPYILGHEQHHFDIAYLGTLVFIQKLKQAHFTIDNYREKLNSIYNDSIEQMEKLQQKYDGETQNGQLKEQQLAWNSKIDEQLQGLSVK